MLRTERLRCSAGVYLLNPNYILTGDRIAGRLDNLAGKYDLAQGPRLSRPFEIGKAPGRCSAMQIIVPNLLDLA